MSGAVKGFRKKQMFYFPVLLQEKRIVWMNGLVNIYCLCRLYKSPTNYVLKHPKLILEFTYNNLIIILLVTILSNVINMELPKN